MIHLHLISRDWAKARGLKHFFTGKPCKYNQVALRRTSNGCCMCYLHSALLIASSDQWRKENPERRRITNRNYERRQRLAPQNPTFEIKK